MTHVKIGDVIDVTVKPASGEPRRREGEVFAIDGESLKLEVRAPGTPRDPYTVTRQAPNA